MVCCVYSDSPQRRDSNENTQHTVMLQKIKEILIIPPDLALLSILTGSNYPCLELIFMVPKMFEPMKFDCTQCRILPLASAIKYVMAVNLFALDSKIFLLPCVHFNSISGLSGQWKGDNERPCAMK